MNILSEQYIILFFSLR